MRTVCPVGQQLLGLLDIPEGVHLVLHKGNVHKGHVGLAQQPVLPGRAVAVLQAVPYPLQHLTPPVYLQPVHVEKAPAVVHLHMAFLEVLGQLIQPLQYPAARLRATPLDGQLEKDAQEVRVVPSLPKVFQGVQKAAVFQV